MASTSSSSQQHSACGQKDENMSRSNIAFNVAAPMLAAWACVSLSAPAFGGPDFRTRSCEVRPTCTILVAAPNRCEDILDWTGSCHGGFAQGVGAVHYADATAAFGWYQKGRLTGTVVWHRNGLLASPGEYLTQVISLNNDGVAVGSNLACSWDEDADRPFKRDREERLCVDMTEHFGTRALSHDVWKAFAKRMTEQLAGPRRPQIRAAAKAN